MTDFNSQFKPLDKKNSTRLGVNARIGLAALTASVIGIAVIANTARAEPLEIHESLDGVKLWTALEEGPNAVEKYIMERQTPQVAQTLAETAKVETLEIHESLDGVKLWTALEEGPDAVGKYMIERQIPQIEQTLAEKIQDTVISGSSAVTMRFILEIHQISIEEIPEIDRDLFNRALNMAAEQMYQKNDCRDMTVIGADSLIQTILEETNTALINSLGEIYGNKDVATTIQKISTMLVNRISREIHDENVAMDFLEGIHDKLPEMDDNDRDFISHLAYLTQIEINKLNNNNIMIGKRSDETVLRNTRDFFVDQIKANPVHPDIWVVIENIADEVVEKLLSGETEMPSAAGTHAIFDDSFSTFPVRQIEGKLYQVEDYVQFERDRETDDALEQNDI